MSERLRLVKSFDELREGVIVVIKPCPLCGGSHRGMIANANTDEALSMDGERVERSGMPSSRSKFGARQTRW